MSIIKGAKNMENAKKWYDWALTPEAQSIGAQAKVSYQVPSNKNASAPPQAPKLNEIKLINYDFKSGHRGTHPAADEVGQGSLDLLMSGARCPRRQGTGRIRVAPARSAGRRCAFARWRSASRRAADGGASVVARRSPERAAWPLVAAPRRPSLRVVGRDTVTALAAGLGLAWALARGSLPA
jgi:hypothetical protein